MHNTDLTKLCANLKYFFKDISLLQTALMHPSAAHLNKKTSYERMEFFGDAILSFIIREFLYNTYVKKSEGELSKMHSFVVSRKVCAKVGLKLQIQDFLILSGGAEQNNERTEMANIANTMESIICAIYLDGGIKNTQNFIIDNWSEFLKNTLSQDFDYKTILQQIVQSKYKILPFYKVIDASGPDHNPNFIIEVDAVGMTAKGNGKNKKEAELVAAQKMLEMLKQKR